MQNPMTKHLYDRYKDILERHQIYWIGVERIGIEYDDIIVMIWLILVFMRVLYCIILIKIKKLYKIQV